MNKPLYIEIHALQTVPPSNINRDDTGSPKTARFGGVVRARVSSQAWKKAIRDEFARTLDADELGQRTKHPVDLIADSIENSGFQGVRDEALSLAADALAATGIKVKDNVTGYLLFISPMQASRLAELAMRAKEHGEKIDGKAAKAVLNPKEEPELNAIDIAMFGRMVADDPSLNVDAAVQVAHAIGVSRSEIEYDYFTAMDDRSPEDNAGAAMIETTEFMSSTLYRYATVDVYHLCENLGSHVATCKAVEAFVRAFLTSMPKGKQNSFANATLPSAVLVQLNSRQPVNLSNAFEVPVYPRDDTGIIGGACEKLIKQEQLTRQAFGIVPSRSLILVNAEGAESLEMLEGAERMNLDSLIATLSEEVEAYLLSSDLPADMGE